MSSETKFEKLLSPGYIGKLKLRNRIIRPGAILDFVDKEGFITNRHKAFYGALARGGAGLAIAGGCTIDQRSFRPDDGMICLFDDKFIPGLTELAQAVHKYDGRIFALVLYQGVFATNLPPDKQPTMSEMSYVRRPPVHSEAPRELTIADIKDIPVKFAEASERVKKAGWDGVEVNGNSFHTINSFMSRIFNKRHDEYGCDSLENRARLFVEIIQAIKNRLGKDFPVTARFTAKEFGRPEATTVEEAKEFAKMLEAAGADALHVMGMGFGPPDPYVWHWNEQIFYPEPPEHLPEGLDWSHRGAGATVPLAAAIKKVVSIPIMTVGRIDPVMAEQILQEGKADFIGLQRRLIADPELPNKLAKGKLEDIAPCTACLQCLDLNIPVPCRINGAMGGDEEYVIPPTEKKKKVVVVGGGPAGMEAARVAAIRGHEVILYEKESKLGGLLPLAALVKGTDIEDLPDLIHYLKTQITRLGVKIELGKEFTPALLDVTKPDVVILATGGLPAVPDIPGINRPNVISGPSLHHTLKSYLRFFDPVFLRWLTKFWMPIGKRVVIIGGAIQGCELAEFLVKRGRKVTIVDTADMLGDKMPLMNRFKLLHWLGEKGVTMLTGVKYEEITDKGLIVTTREGKRQTIEADTIATAVPLSPNTALLKALKGKIAEVYAVGDCSEPRLIINAVADGYHTARAV
jgi:2,4-dienoyl-CoA reductase (NADPH2)